jgi:hypothetical protein
MKQKRKMLTLSSLARNMPRSFGRVHQLFAGRTVVIVDQKPALCSAAFHFVFYLSLQLPPRPFPPAVSFGIASRKSTPVGLLTLLGIDWKSPDH